MTKENIKDYSININQATRTGLVVITYNIIVDYLDDAMAAFAKKDMDGFRGAIRKAKPFLAELTKALDMKYPISGNLMSIYLFMNKSLVKADIKLDTTEIPRIKKMLIQLRDAFIEVGRNDEPDPVMQGFSGSI